MIERSGAALDARRSGRPLAGSIAGITLSALLGTALLLFLAVPIAGLLGSAGVEGARRIGSDSDLRGALWRTVWTATTATLLAAAGGTPLAWLLARRRFRGRALVGAIIDLPLLLPHPVAGIALLLVLGRESAAGSALLALGMRIAGSTTGIICAMLFVSAPLYVSAAREAFARVDPRYESVARTLGDDVWRAVWRVTLPMAARGLLAAAVVTWARAVSEFGAIVVITYHPNVASVLSYDRFVSFGLREALPVAAALLLLALLPLVALRALRADARGDA
jgi:molybdate/tungstate transport system permease protein